MSKQNQKGEKIQIVAFSTNESENSPNDLINVYLEKNNHVIIKKKFICNCIYNNFTKNFKANKNNDMFCS